MSRRRSASRARASLHPRGRPVRRSRLWPAVFAVALLGLGLPPASAQAAETVKLAVGFSPYRLGVNSAFTFGLEIGSTTGPIPSPATSIALRLPAEMGLTTSQLGLDVCGPAVLRAHGVAGCPHEAVMGDGKAVLKTAAGSEGLEVPVAVTVVMAPAQHEQTQLAFYAESEADVIAELVFPGAMLGDSRPFGSQISLRIPPTAGVPGAPPPALTDMSVTIAPPGLLYAKRVHGKTVRYHPKGLAVPTVCPAGGFPFAANLHFADGTSVVAATSLACPPKTTRSANKGHRK